LEKRGKNEKGKNKNTKNTNVIQKTSHRSNPEGHEEVRASIPAAISCSLTQILEFVDLSQKNLKGGENLG
jgi:hypothetical protein